MQSRTLFSLMFHCKNMTSRHNRSLFFIVLRLWVKIRQGRDAWLKVTFCIFGPSCAMLGRDILTPWQVLSLIQLHDILLSYLARLKAVDLSPSEGPSLARGGHPEDRRSPWTWDRRLFQGLKKTEEVPPFPFPSALSTAKTPKSPHQATRQLITQLRRLVCLFTRWEKWRRDAVKT